MILLTQISAFLQPAAQEAVDLPKAKELRLALVGATAAHAPTVVRARDCPLVHFARAHREAVGDGDGLPPDACWDLCLPQHDTNGDNECISKRQNARFQNAE